MKRDIERATRKVWVYASDEILAELSNGWSRAVSLHAEPWTDGSWELSIRAMYDKAGNVIDYKDT